MHTIALERQKPGKLIERETIDAIVRAIAERCSPERITLFGSYITGDPSPDSDLDLLIVMDTDLPKHKRATPIRLLFRPAPCPMDIFVYTPEEAAYWEGAPNHIVTVAASTGKVVYARAKY